MNNILTAVILLSSLILAGCSCSKPPESTTTDKIKTFQMTKGSKATCIAGTVNKDNNKMVTVDQTLLLVDLTDPLLPNQIEYVKNNYIDNISWAKLGDTFSMASMTSEPPEKMTVVSICAPELSEKTSTSVGQPNNSKINIARNRQFKEVYRGIFDDLLQFNDKPANNSLLIESVNQIYSNARYNFSSKNGPRHLILVSDLYQNSSEISFYDCNLKKEECSFSNVKKKKAGWFKAASLNLTKKDRVTIYHLSSKCRVDLKARDWWESYFISEGAGKVEVISELGTNQCADEKKKREEARKLEAEQKKREAEARKLAEENQRAKEAEARKLAAEAQKAKEAGDKEAARKLAAEAQRAKEAAEAQKVKEAARVKEAEAQKVKGRKGKKTNSGCKKDGTAGPDPFKNNVFCVK